MKFCNNCKIINEDISFCKVCGNKLKDSKIPEEYKKYAALILAKRYFEAYFELDKIYDKNSFQKAYLKFKSCL